MNQSSVGTVIQRERRCFELRELVHTQYKGCIFKLALFLIMCMYVLSLMCGCVHMSAGTCGGQKGVLDSVLDPANSCRVPDIHAGKSS